MRAATGDWFRLLTDAGIIRWDDDATVAVPAELETLEMVREMPLAIAKPLILAYGLDGMPAMTVEEIDAKFGGGNSREKIEIAIRYGLELLAVKVAAEFPTPGE